MFCKLYRLSYDFKLLQHCGKQSFRDRHRSLTDRATRQIIVEYVSNIVLRKRAARMPGMTRLRTDFSTASRLGPARLDDIARRTFGRILRSSLSLSQLLPELLNSLLQLSQALLLCGIFIGETAVRLLQCALSFRR